MAYGKCWKNHAAVRGGFDCDGCQEFMPSERDREKCVACGCHRCFHSAKYSATLVNEALHLPLGDVAGHSRGRTQQPPPSTMAFAPMPITAVLPASPLFGNQTPPQPLPRQVRRCPSSANPAMPAPGIPQQELMEEGRDRKVAMQRPGSPERRAKRSKLSEGQKAEMRSFAERLGWRVQGQDEAELKMFCAAMGLRTNWFKLWMHKSKPAPVTPSSNVDPTSNPPNHA